MSGPYLAVSNPGDYMRWIVVLVDGEQIRQVWPDRGPFTGTLRRRDARRVARQMNHQARKRGKDRRNAS